MDEKPKKGFLYWYKNVFKYHYGKLAIVLALAAFVVIFNILDARTKIEYDFHMAIAVQGAIPYASVSELSELVEEVVGDINGDGEVHINIQILDMSVDGEETQYRLMLMMALPENVVFIMDDHYSTLNAKHFNELTDYGITPDEMHSQRVYIGDTPIMEHINSDIEFYACLADWTTDGKGDPIWTEAGVGVIKAIIDSK